MIVYTNKISNSYPMRIAFQNLNNKSAVDINKDNTSVSNGVKIAGTLAGLAVLGYTGVKFFRQKPNSVNLSQDVIPQELLDKFRGWLGEIRNIKAAVWKSDGPVSKCVENPEASACLSKLDNLTPLEKKAFVKEYCDMTGFPNLEKVSTNIDKEILNTIDKISEETGQKPLFVGYDINNSVGRHRALPGSDCDGLMIVYNTDYPGPIWDVTLKFGDTINQRMVNITGTHYPDVLGIEFLKQSISKADNIFSKIATPEKVEQYEKNLTYDGKSYVQAAQFNIDIARHLDKKDRDEVCWAGFFVEMLRAGKVLLNNISPSDIDFIKRSALYKYSNTARQEGLKNILKPKLENRTILSRRFPDISDEEKFEVCRDLLRNSLGVKSENTTEGAFEEFDMGDILEMYKKISNFCG